jgi:hypothetical protein
MRSKIELDALAKGYDRVFWNHLPEDEIVELGCLSVAGALPQPAP